MLKTLSTFPAGFLDTPAQDLHRLLSGPTLIHLPGRRTPALFVSVLLHGNEDSGLIALQQVMRQHAGRELPRAMSVLIGNVTAAKLRQRRLDGQPDYNRVWPGTQEHINTQEAAAMAAAHRSVVERGLFAAIDIHNNTGLNPHYGIVNRVDSATLHLALLFSRTVVWFDGLAGTQTTSFAPVCPAVAVECGQPGHPANAQAAARFITACLNLADFPRHSVPQQDIDLYRSQAQVMVSDDVSFGFDGRPADVSFDAELDHLNFRPLPAGAILGRTRHQLPLLARDAAGKDVTDQYISIAGGLLQLKQAATLAMLTREERIVRQDCLCYLMQRISLDDE